MNSAAPARVERAAASGRRTAVMMKKRVGICAPHALEHLDPFHAGHPDVDEGGGVRVLPQEGEGLLPSSARSAANPSR